MAMREADSWSDTNKTQHEEEREGVLVPVRYREHIREEKLPEEPDKGKVWKIQRRWHVY